MQLFKLLIASKKNKFVNKKAVLIVICSTFIVLDQIYKTQKGETDLNLLHLMYLQNLTTIILILQMMIF